jgi:hypothetical protein
MGRNIFDIIGGQAIKFCQGIEPALRSILDTLLNALKALLGSFRDKKPDLSYPTYQKALEKTDLLPSTHFGTKRAKASDLPKVKKSLEGKPTPDQLWLERITKEQNRLQKDYVDEVENYVKKINDMATKVTVLIDDGVKEIKLPIFDHDSIGFFGPQDPPKEGKYVTLTVSQLLEKLEKESKKKNE